MNSKIGVLTQLAHHIRSSLTAPKQLNLYKLGDAGGFEDGDASAVKNQLLSSFVYNTNEFKNWSCDTAGAPYSKQFNGAETAQLV